MEYQDNREIVNRLLAKHNYLIKHKGTEQSSRVLNGKLYLSCFVKTYSEADYILISPDYNYYRSKDAFLKGDYISACNQGIIGKKDDKQVEGSTFISYTNTSLEEADFITEGRGAALVVCEIDSLSIEKIFYFYDTYNLEDTASIELIHDNSIVIGFEEHTVVISLLDYSFISFSGVGNYKRVKDLLFTSYYAGYDEYGELSVIDLKSLKKVGYSSLFGVGNGNTTEWLNFKYNDVNIIVVNDVLQIQQDDNYVCGSVSYLFSQDASDKPVQLPSSYSNELPF